MRSISVHRRSSRSSPLLAVAPTFQTSISWNLSVAYSARTESGRRALPACAPSPRARSDTLIVYASYKCLLELTVFLNLRLWVPSARSAYTRRGREGGRAGGGPGAGHSASRRLWALRRRGGDRGRSCGGRGLVEGGGAAGAGSTGRR